MQRFTLYTYKNRDEFESFYKKKEDDGYIINPVSYTHLTLPTNREV